MAGAMSSLMGPVYAILMEDADGRHLLLECLQDLGVARQRLQALAPQYPGIRLIHWNHKTRIIPAEADSY